MSSEWENYCLNDAGRIVTGKTPKTGVPEYEGYDLPFVTPPDFVGAKWVSKTVRTISTAAAQSVKTSLIPPRSVLVTCIGSDMGKAAIAGSACVTNQQINAVVVDESKFCPEFLYYNLSLRKNEIRGSAGGSAQPILNKTAFGQISFDAPSLSEQRIISQIVSPLDDRITLLRETNQTLEAIAQAIFKSWFVDFDPVRAKMEGRRPVGMDEETAALFPDELVESELGLIPKCWSIDKFASIANIKGGKQLPKEHFISNGKNPIFGGAGVMGWTDLFNASGFVITLGRVGAYCGQFFWHLGDSWVNNNASLILPNKVQDSQWIYLWLKTVDIEKIKKGAAQPFVSNGDVSALKISIPPRSTIDKFCEVSGPIFQRIANVSMTIGLLTDLRETLLPRLISGKLRVPVDETDAVANEE